MKFSLIKKRLEVFGYIALYIPLVFLLFVLCMNGRNTGDSATYVLILFFSLCLFAPLWNWLWGFAAITVTIDETGVSYHTRKIDYHMDWKDIKFIVLMPDMYGRHTKNCLVCFLTTQIVPPHCYEYESFNESYFGVQYRPEVVAKIREYTDMPIMHISSVE